MFFFGLNFLTQKIFKPVKSKSMMQKAIDLIQSELRTLYKLLITKLEDKI